MSVPSASIATTSTVKIWDVGSATPHLFYSFFDTAL